MASFGSDNPLAAQQQGSPREMAAYSRARGGARYTQASQSRRKRRNVIVGVAASIVSIVVVALAVGAIWAATFVGSIGQRLNEDVTEETRAVLADQQATAAELTSNWTDMSPFYMLLLGSDSSTSRRTGDEAELYGDDDSAFRTDTIILARIDPGNKKVTLVSIHRDTWYPIDGVYQKINAAYSIGGVPKTIEVISEFAGVPISHYAEIDMTGLSAIVDALGGVEVDVPYEIDDEEYTGHLDKGLQTLNGEQALIFARSRHAYDDLGDGDRYRAAHQRLLIAAIAEKLMDSSATDMIAAIDTVANYINTDFTLDQIVNLALAMRGIDMENDVYSTMNPTTATYENNTWYEIPDDEAWAELMAQVDAGEKPDADLGYISVTDDINNPDHVDTNEADGNAAATAASTAGDARSASAQDATSAAVAGVEVSVRDASNAGRGAEVAQTLQASGWDVVDSSQANLSLNATTVVYEGEAYADAAASIASQLGATAQPAGDEWLVTGDVMVVVGAN